MNYSFLMKKVFFTMMLAMVSSVWMANEASNWCMPSVRTLTEPWIEVNGTFQAEGFPCEPDELCPPCLTIVLVTSDKTYYLVTDDGQLIEYLDTIQLGTKATVSGAPFTHGNYNYIQVHSVETRPLRLNSLCDEWNVLAMRNPNTSAQLLRFSHYYLTTDTMINGLHYVQVQLNDQYKGALREDDNANIYYVPADSTHEYLLYAFHAQVGDELENLWVSYTNLNKDAVSDLKVTISEIKPTTPKTIVVDVSFTLTSGEVREHFNRQFEWLDGIGNVGGPFFANLLNGPINSDSNGDLRGVALLCAHKDGEQVYVSEWGEKYGCDVNSFDFQKLFMGDWNLVQETTFGPHYDANGNIVNDTTKHVLNDSLCYEIMYVLATEVIWGGPCADPIYPSPTYTFQEQEDGTWLVTLLYQDQTQKKYTIRTLTEYALVWETKEYHFGEDKEPTTYRQYFRRDLHGASERWCMPQERVSEGNTIRVGGTLKEVSAPCINDSEEEPCLPCLTIALKSRLKTYYLVSDDAEVLAILDTVSEGLPAIAEGIAFTNGSYSYLQVSKIKPVIVSEFQQRLIGNWQVYKSTITGSYQDENREYSDGETMDFQDTWWNIDATTIDMQGPAVDNWGERLTYTLREQADGTWQIIVPRTYSIDYQQGTNEIILCTIHQLTTDRMEWEFTSVNSDGTSTTYHEYLWRLPHTEEEPQYFPKGMQWTLDRWQEEKGIVSHSISSCIVQGDTVINDKTYRNIVDGDFIAPIRQEGKKIYVHLNDKDFLLYDFGLEVGDSIPAYGGYGYDPNNELPEIEVDRVVRIDSVTLLDGRKAKVFFYEYRSPDIEYVGDEEFGVLNPIFGEQACTCLDRGQSMCCSLNGKPIYGACGNLHENDVDTIPMYIKDGPGTSTVEPVDPNQIIVTLNGDKLTIHEYLGTEISYVLTKAPSGNNMPARKRKMADDTFSESVSIQLKESGLYTLELTNPEWGYTIVGTFEYGGMQGIEPVETVVPAAQKILRDGQLLIRKGDKTYTITGTEIR